MKVLLTKHTFLRSLTAILTLAILLLPGCDGDSSTSSGSDVVRQPTGDVETFWDSFDWDELTPAEQELWARLGWNEANWDGTAAAPASEVKDWSELTPDEQAAATELGYTQEYWDSLP